MKETCFGIYHENNHGNKKQRRRVECCQLAGTQWSVLHCISTDWHPLRWTGGASGVPSPCVLKLLETECGTHTHTGVLEGRYVTAQTTYRMSEYVPEDVQDRTLYRSWMFCSYNMFLQESVPQECPTRVSYKSVPQECPV